LKLLWYEDEGDWGGAVQVEEGSKEDSVETNNEKKIFGPKGILHPNMRPSRGHFDLRVRENWGRHGLVRCY
jgi:hypothetical protein